LDYAAAIAKLWEQELAAFAKVIKPAANGNGLAVVLADFCDGGYGRWHGFKVSTSRQL
jgi:hypothetical protein